MPIKPHGRQYDLVVFGATGYTGQLTAEHIATSLPSNLKWAVAGRSEAKLRSVVEDCRRLNPDRTEPGIEICSLNSEDLDALAKKTCVLITTVGPYIRYGEYAFRACAENGTHYLDVTGEVPFTSRMINKYEKIAQSTGAIMIPQDGIESAPSDLVTWSLAKALRSVGAKTGDVTLAVKISAAPSGGTLATAIDVFDTIPITELRTMRQHFALSPIPHPDHQPQTPSLLTALTGVRRHPTFGLLTTSVANRTDGPIVERTWGLLSETPSRKEEFYGPKFSFVQYMRTKTWLEGIKIHYALSIFGMLLILLPPFRRLVERFMYKPGQGPARELSNKDWVDYKGIAESDPDSKVGRKAYSHARYNGPMYYFTGVIVSHAAMTILEDDHRLGGGVYTPACLGQGYIDRLGQHGFKIETSLMEE